MAVRPGSGEKTIDLSKKLLNQEIASKEQKFFIVSSAFHSLAAGKDRPYFRAIDHLPPHVQVVQGRDNSMGLDRSKLKTALTPGMKKEGQQVVVEFVIEIQALVLRPGFTSVFLFPLPSKS